MHFIFLNIIPVIVFSMSSSETPNMPSPPVRTLIRESAAPIERRTSNASAGLPSTRTKPWTTPGFASTSVSAMSAVPGWTVVITERPAVS